MLYLCKDAKVMLTVNLWSAIGFCNGSTGSVVDFIYQDNQRSPDLPIAVVVHFDNYTGPPLSQDLPSCVPICPITTAQLPNGIHERQQLPFKLSWAITIHKSQGLTLPNAWINIGEN